MKRWLISMVVLAATFLVAPQLAAADTASAPARLSRTVITVGGPGLAKVNVHEKFASVDSVCFDFAFVSDLLDPGEILLVTPLQLFPSLTGPGFENGGSTPEAQRTLCLESSLGYSDITALFANGKDKDLEIGMQSGSVEIASLVVTVTGTPA